VATDRTTPPEDLADLRRLLALVERRRDEFVQAGKDTREAEALLSKLKEGLVRATAGQTGRPSEA
jgi:hypothetical protein